MESGEEGRKLPFEELVAPEILAEGQNFYDQPPFSAVLALESQSSGVDRFDLSRGLTKIVKSEKDEFLTREYIQKNLGEVRQNLAIRLYGIMPALNSENKRKYQGSIENIIKSLAKYPNWSEYVKEQMYTSHFKTTGEFAPREKLFSGMPESYAAWTNRHYNNRQRQILLGIEEVFPQGAYQTSVQDSSSGKPGKRWRILTASNLIQERR